MIEFTTIRWKNLLSTGNTFTEVQLNRSPNTLIVGDNGSGKSTILDALCFALYGKPFRKIKKDQLINSINSNNAIVEVEFTSYNRKYKVIRGLRPNVFEIYTNGALLNQTAATKDYQEILEKNILKMNMKSFTQIVILGSSSFVPFMQLAAGVRREVIEDFLDIKVFSIMGYLLKDRVSEANKDYLLVGKDISSSKNMIKLQEDHQKRMSQDTNKLIDDTKKAIDTAENSISVAISNIDNIQLNIDDLKVSISDETLNTKKMIEIERLGGDLKSKVRKLKEGISFYEENDHCPTCTQDIDQDIKTEKMEEKQNNISKIKEALDKLEQTQQDVIERNHQIIAVQSTIKDYTKEIQNITMSINEDRREIRMHNQRIEELNTSHIVEVQNIIEDLTSKLDDLNKNHEQITKTKETYDIAQVILRDSGIKSRIIKQYIPVINALVNKYLAAMDFFVKFELNESFEEKILSRHRDDFTYDSFSEGEKMRIDLALLFTWRTVARMKNSASANLLILDEVFDASLDATGCEEFLKLIQTLENANVFVISHKGDILQDKFRSSIRFEKHHNFSRIST